MLFLKTLLLLQDFTCFSEEFVVKASPSKLEQEYKIATSLCIPELIFLPLNKELVLEMLNNNKYNVIFKHHSLKSSKM